jgi:hypothetical protein
MHPLKNSLVQLTCLLLLSILIGSCTQKLNREAEAPADLIPRDTMVSIFVDLRLMDAVINYEQRQGNRQINDIKYYLHNSVLDKYGITREQFEQSFTYYQADLEVIDNIYADAITRLSKVKSQIEQE